AQRDLNPVYDNLHFDLGFPRGMRPFLLTLRADLPSPFIPAPHPLEEAEETKQKECETPGTESKVEQPATPPPVVIDLEGIAERVVAFPVPEGLYGQVAGIQGKALFTSFP